MKRFTSVILSIFVGAFAVAIGMGLFLQKANNDRAHLAQVAQAAQETAQAAQNASQHAIDEANTKLDAANGEIAKAQALVKALQEERTLLLHATVLKAPSTKTMKSWHQTIDIDLGVGLTYPGTSTIETNDKTALTLANGTDRWLSITPYDDRLEQELLNAFTTSTPVTYVVNNHLLVGAIGQVASSTGDVTVLRAQSDGVPSHLIWIRKPSGVGSVTVTDILATLSFQN